MGLNKKLFIQSDSALVNTENFAPVTYTGNGATNTISSLNFQPDLVWIKGRDNTWHHIVFDVNRGNNWLETDDATHLEAAASWFSFQSNGFKFTSVGGAVNANNEDFVAWCWKAGGSGSTYNIDNTGYSTASAAGLDGGDINPTGASINKAAGFGIYTASPTVATQSISHGFNSAPEMYIFKRTDAAGDWYVSVNVGGTWKLGTLNGTGTLSTTASYTADANTMVIGGGGSVDEVIYAFHSVDSYQKIGSYTGTGGNSTNTITTGFAPRFLMIKRTDSTGGWRLFDTARSSGSYPIRINHSLRANLSNAEYDASGDSFGYGNFTSTGFEFTTNHYNADLNANNGTYIYLAIA